MKISLRFSQILNKVILLLLLVTLSLIVIHAPMVIGLGTLFASYSLEIKAWKEIIIAVVAVLLITYMIINHKLSIIKDKIVIASLIFIAIHFLILIFINNGFMATVSGLMIDLRFVAFFVELYIFLKLNPEYKKLFIISLILGAVIVLVFALLQVTILPRDILKYIGYGDNTIEPYLLVDKSNQFVRINSTLRGPNPLGAYATICIIMAFTYLLSHINEGFHKLLKQKKIVLAIAIIILAIIALWFSYSRSALLATLTGIFLIVVIKLAKKWPKIIALSLTTIVLAIVITLAISWKTAFVQQVVLHENPDGGSITKSDSGHISSLVDGINSVIKKPLGYGIGSTGSASMYTKKPIIVENQFVFTAREVGIIGLIALLILLLMIFVKLFKEINVSSFILGTLVCGLMMCFVGLFLPVWTDDTISIISWGMFAIALNYGGQKKETYERKNN